MLEAVAEHQQLKHLILMCSAVNGIDASALESLEAINHRLADGGIKLHLSEVKGPVMDALQKSQLLNDLSGRVFLSQHAAFIALLATADEENLPKGIDDLWLTRGLI